MTTNTFPLLNQIDEGIHSEDIDWNKNAFQTLLVSENPSQISITKSFFSRLPIYQARQYSTMPLMSVYDA